MQTDSEIKSISRVVLDEGGITAVDLNDRAHHYTFKTTKEVADVHPLSSLPSVLHFQDGPIPMHGVNGVTTEAVLAVLIHRTKTLNDKFPCTENEQMISHMEAAIAAGKARTANRIARNVEGTYKV